MAPTLENNDRLVVDKLAYELNDPQPGDIAMLRYPAEPSKMYVKRVVGVPGDTLQSEDGVVFRNGARVPDNFVEDDFRSFDTWGPVTVPPGQYFVMGDHRNDSADSREHWFVPRYYILGRVWVRWWPLSDMRTFPAFK